MATLVKLQFLGQDVASLSGTDLELSLSKTQRYARDAYSASGATLLGAATFMEGAVNAKTRQKDHPKLFAKLSAYRNAAKGYNKELDNFSEKLEMRNKVGACASEPDLRADQDIINKKYHNCVRMLKKVGTEQLVAAREVENGNHANASIDEKILDGMMLTLSAEQTLTQLDMPHVLEADTALYNR